MAAFIASLLCLFTLPLDHAGAATPQWEPFTHCPVPDYAKLGSGNRSEHNAGTHAGTGGLDIFAARGSAIMSPASGAVFKVGTGSTSGLRLWMRLDQQIEGRSVYVFMAHLDSFDPRIASATSGDPNRGIHVPAGVRLGGVGDSGNARGTSPHLHLSFNVSGHTAEVIEWRDGMFRNDPFPNVQRVCTERWGAQVSPYVDIDVPGAFPCFSMRLRYGVEAARSSLGRIGHVPFAEVLSVRDTCGGTLADRATRRREAWIDVTSMRSFTGAPAARRDQLWVRPDGGRVRGQGETWTTAHPILAGASANMVWGFPGERIGPGASTGLVSVDPPVVK